MWKKVMIAQHLELQAHIIQCIGPVTRVTEPSQLERVQIPFMAWSGSRINLQFLACIITLGWKQRYLCPQFIIHMMALFDNLERNIENDIFTYLDANCSHGTFRQFNLCPAAVSFFNWKCWLFSTTRQHTRRDQPRDLMFYHLFVVCICTIHIVWICRVCFGSLISVLDFLSFNVVWSSSIWPIKWCRSRKIGCELRINFHRSSWLFKRVRSFSQAWKDMMWSKPTMKRAMKCDSVSNKALLASVSASDAHIFYNASDKFCPGQLRARR